MKSNGNSLFKHLTVETKSIKVYFIFAIADVVFGSDVLSIQILVLLAKFS